MVVTRALIVPCLLPIVDQTVHARLRVCSFQQSNLAIYCQVILHDTSYRFINYKSFMLPFFSGVSLT